MKGNFHVRFLGGPGAGNSPGLPGGGLVSEEGAQESEGKCQPDWGLDAPVVVRRMTLGGAVALVAGFVGLTLDAARLSGPLAVVAPLALVVGVALFAAAVVMVWGSKHGKLRMRDRLLDTIPWRGNERVLDLGCGHGLLLVGAARRLTTGTAIGIDIWRSYDQAENTPGVTRENGRIKGVADRIEVLSGDVRELPFDGQRFDVVVSSLAIHNVEDQTQRATAIREVARVLRPGGRVAIMDIKHAREYCRVLLESGLVNVRRSRPNFMFMLPTFMVTAEQAPVERTPS
jgi:arsenite methyltransferase